MSKNSFCRGRDLSSLSHLLLISYGVRLSPTLNFNRVRNTRRTLLSLLGLHDCSIFSVENERHLFQAVATCFGIEEVRGEAHRYQYDDENEVVLPSDGFKCDWVDEGVEENG